MTYLYSFLFCGFLCLIAQIILDNSGMAYLKTNTMETAEAISKRLGRMTLESSSISQSVSLTNYNGNKSTSLIGRDLLTPDEVKNLHYKTIIFPNIGYPIFRDTVIYKKLSCYSSGELKRKITPLEDLSYTYFTVEDIQTKYDRLYRNRNNKEINKEELSFYDKFKTEEINKLNNIVNVVNDLLKDKIKLFEFKENNNRTFASFELKEPLNTNSNFTILFPYILTIGSPILRVWLKFEIMLLELDIIFVIPF